MKNCASAANLSKKVWPKPSATRTATARPKISGSLRTTCRPKPTRISRKIWSIRPRRRRPSRNSKPKSSSSKGWKNRPGRACTPAQTAKGAKSPRQRKLIIFTEHRDTLNYLAVKIRGLIGSEEAVVMIHGGIKREERRKVQEL